MKAPTAKPDVARPRADVIPERRQTADVDWYSFRQIYAKAK